jgi:hypothetical protein
MVLTDEQFEALQTLQQRLLDETLEYGLAAQLTPDRVAEMSSRMTLLAQIDAVLATSYGDPDAEAPVEDDDELVDEEDADLDDDPVQVARRMSRD